jgi:deazaflavin-dependent oxidoreductase (nitroreductase family)
MTVDEAGETEENARRRAMNEEIIAEFRANAGRVGAFEGKSDLLLLHHVGARSGERYVSPLAYLRHGEGYVLIAANGGRPRNPSWYHNLVASPETTVEVGPDTVAVRVREAVGEEREALAARARAEAPFFGPFERQTSRRIPFLVLEPVAGAS